MSNAVRVREHRSPVASPGESGPGESGPGESRQGRDVRQSERRCVGGAATRTLMTHSFRISYSCPENRRR